ncbi:hypothetical protein HNQ40_002936 [Algisphaera agarilytica]|uniref:Uncharacterized protein n=1 Tax=Algisphaera agarilytica TaxID=1385975 RepID=A0A7X0LL46_9BACT|nr:hypothetical protein [Algisphaera agarilytica]
MSTKHPVSPVTRERWRKLANTLTEAAEAAEAGEDRREQVGLLVVTEALALNVSTELRESRCGR